MAHSYIGRLRQTAWLLTAIGAIFLMTLLVHSSGPAQSLNYQSYSTRDAEY